jgi:non-heme chloroperoxidase
MLAACRHVDGTPSCNRPDCITTLRQQAVAARRVWGMNQMQITSWCRREREEEKEMTSEITITEHEASQVLRANASTATPVVFVHGLWLLPSSWDRWVTFFEKAGYVALTPGWPDDPDTVAEAREHPEVFAGKGIGEIADYEEAIIRGLDRKPVIIGHSFGGLLTMILAGRGLAAASVAISPAPFRGVLPLPIVALRSASVALRNPANWNRAVPLTYEQFRYSFANAVGEDEAKELYLGYSVAGAGEPLFQAAAANFNPWSEAKVDTMNPERGPMLIISADSDHTVPWAIANASYKRQRRNQSVTEILKMRGRGHALTIDAGWQEVAEKALEFVTRFTASQQKVA